MQSSLFVHALRLTPATDLRLALEELARQHQWPAAVVLSCVGSLSQAQLRLADASEGTPFQGPFEIVSLEGTLSSDGPHLHLALADRQGQVIGGHVLAGCLVYTTAEMVIGVLPELRFARPLDAETGYRELLVQPQGGKSPGT